MASLTRMTYVDEVVLMADDPIDKFDVKSTELFRYYSEIRSVIDKHKWYLSEKAGRDVGYEKAVVDWLINHSKQDVAAIKLRHNIKP